MKQYGLIGFPLSHSFSKKYFTDKFEKEGITGAAYQLFPIEHIDELPALIRAHPNLLGLNITIPHKQVVLPLLNWIEPNAETAGAVNCIQITRENESIKLDGFNTDIYGFEMSLKPLLMSHHRHALILGDGGAAKAVKCVLDKLGIQFEIVTRRASASNLLFGELTHAQIEQHTLIINTTPLGTSPNIHEYPPIPYQAIDSRHLLYDLVYNPEKTVFLEKGEKQGATVKNGYEMLVLQAEKSWEIWTKNMDVR